MAALLQLKAFFMLVQTSMSERQLPGQRCMAEQPYEQYEQASDKEYSAQLGRIRETSLPSPSSNPFQGTKSPMPHPVLSKPDDTCMFERTWDVLQIQASSQGRDNIY